MKLKANKMKPSPLIAAMTLAALSAATHAANPAGPVAQPLPCSAANKPRP
ncbi:hypothetical protein [Cupriavidus basilensis]|nr:hypothetical protein [Cupriavidus basilensis]